MDKELNPHQLKDVKKKGFWDYLLAVILGCIVAIMIVKV